MIIVDVIIDVTLTIVQGNVSKVGRTTYAYVMETPLWCHASSSSKLFLRTTTLRSSRPSKSGPNLACFPCAAYLTMLTATHHTSFNYWFNTCYHNLQSPLWFMDTMKNFLNKMSGKAFLAPPKAQAGDNAVASPSYSIGGVYPFLLSPEFSPFSHLGW